MTHNPPVNYTPLIFPEQTIPEGMLIADMRCQAAWYYYVLAHKVWAVTREGEFGLLEGSPWLDPKYESIALTISAMYQCSIEDFMGFMPIVMLECERLGMIAPQQAYLNPRRIV